MVAGMQLVSGYHTVGVAAGVAEMTGIAEARKGRDPSASMARVGRRILEVCVVGAFDVL